MCANDPAALHARAHIGDSILMRTFFAALWHKHKFACGLGAGVVWRLGAAWLGFGLWNAGHDHLHMLKLAQPEAQAWRSSISISAVDPSTSFGDGLLRPLMRGVIWLLQHAHLAAPEDLVLAVGILAVMLRVCVSLLLWRLARGFFGASRMGHGAWAVVGLLQGALVTVSIGGILALGQTPQTQLMVTLREDAQASAVVAIGAALEPYFLDGRVLPLAQHPTRDETWLKQTILRLEAAHTPANRFVFFAQDQDKSEVMLILEGLSCQAPQLYQGGWLDRLAVTLNPKRHASRGAVVLYRCAQATDFAGLIAPKAAPGRGDAQRAPRLGATDLALAEVAEAELNAKILGAQKAHGRL